MTGLIMIVDDSPTMLFSLRMTLAAHDIKVLAASSGEEAVATLTRGERPDMMFTDLNMGGMNGIELIRQVRKMRGLQFMPIVLLTTESQMEKKLEAKAAGATGWLGKPATADAMMKVVNQVMRH